MSSSEKYHWVTKLDDMINSKIFGYEKSDFIFDMF
jgi:hypothetical protein